MRPVRRRHRVVRRSAQQAPAPLPVEPDVELFPLQVSPNGRYLVDQNGDPFLLSGDAGWTIANHLPVADQNDYLDHLVNVGYNATILMNIVRGGAESWPNVNEPADVDGVQPFTTANQFSSANDTYFLKVANYIERANQRGIVVLLFICYAGYDGGADGWESTMNSPNTNSTCFNFGAYLANKYPHLNVIPMMMGDNTAEGTTLTRYQNMLSGWQSVSRNRLCGSELSSPDTLVTDQSGFTYGTNPATTDMHINSYYGAGPSDGAQGDGRTYVTALQAWDNSPTLPAQLQEPVYEDAFYNSNNSRVLVRSAHHWARTSGTYNTLSGVHGRWQGTPVGLEGANSPSANWRTRLNGNVDNDQAKSIAFYSALEWWRLIPSGTTTGRAGRNLITTTNTQNLSYISASVADDGSFMVAYVGSNGTGTRGFSIDPRSLSANYRARWWNPTTGVFIDIAGGAYSFSNAATSEAFTTPGNNGTGTNDWILLCEVPP